MIDGCAVRPVKQHTVLAKYYCPCWVGPAGAGCARTRACSVYGCGCGCQSLQPWIDSLDGLRRTHAQHEQRTVTFPYISPNPSLSHSGHLQSLQDLVEGPCAPLGPSSSKLQKGSSVQHSMCWMPLHLRWQQVDLWTTVFENTAQLRWTVNKDPLLLPALAIEWIYPRQWWHTQPHLDLLHAGILAHPAPTGPIQQGQRYFARTVCCTNGLTIQPLCVLLFLCYYY